MEAVADEGDRVLLDVSGLSSFLDDESLLIVELLNQNVACSTGANGSASYRRHA
jgi:hypothetical protein